MEAFSLSFNTSDLQIMEKNILKILPVIGSNENLKLLIVVKHLNYESVFKQLSHAQRFDKNNLIRDYFPSKLKTV